MLTSEFVQTQYDSILLILILLSTLPPDIAQQPSQCILASSRLWLAGLHLSVQSTLETRVTASLGDFLVGSWGLMKRQAGASHHFSAPLWPSATGLHF